MVNKSSTLPLDAGDDGREVLDLEGICSRPMHVDESRAEVIQSAGTILLAQAPDCPLQAKRAEIEEAVCRTIAHAWNIAPGRLLGNLHQ